MADVKQNNHLRIISAPTIQELEKQVNDTLTTHYPNTNGFWRKDGAFYQLMHNNLPPPAAPYYLDVKYLVWKSFEETTKQINQLIDLKFQSPNMYNIDGKIYILCMRYRRENQPNPNDNVTTSLNLFTDRFGALISLQPKTTIVARNLTDNVYYLAKIIKIERPNIVVQYAGFWSDIEYTIPLNEENVVAQGDFIVSPGGCVKLPDVPNQLEEKGDCVTFNDKFGNEVKVCKDAEIIVRTALNLYYKARVINVQDNKVRVHVIGLHEKTGFNVKINDDNIFSIQSHDLFHKKIVEDENNIFSYWIQ